MFSDNHAEFLLLLENVRSKILAQMPDSHQRKALMGKLADDASFGILVKDGAEKWRNYAHELIANTLAEK